MTLNTLKKNASPMNRRGRLCDILCIPRHVADPRGICDGNACMKTNRFRPRIFGFESKRGSTPVLRNWQAATDEKPNQKPNRKTNTMKETLNTYEIADRLFRDEYAGFSYEGAKALAEYLEQLEEDCGEEMEFDGVAIRCDYSEHASLQDWAADYFSGDWREEVGVEDCDGEDADDKIRVFLLDHGQLIEFDGGIIVSSF